MGWNEETPSKNKGFPGNISKKLYHSRKTFQSATNIFLIFLRQKKRGTWQTKQVSRTETFILNHTPKYQVLVNLFACGFL